VTVLGHVHYGHLSPAEQEVAASSTREYRQAEPSVVRHEAEHQAIRQRDLQDVKDRLYQMRRRHHLGHRASSIRSAVRDGLFGAVHRRRFGTDDGDLSSSRVDPALDQVLAVALESFVECGESEKEQARSE